MRQLARDEREEGGGVGNYYFTGSLEMRAHYANNKPITSIPIIVHDVTNEKIIEFNFNSINEAEKKLKIHHQFIKHHLALGSIYTSRQNRKFRFFTASPDSAANADKWRI